MLKQIFIASSMLAFSCMAYAEQTPTVEFMQKALGKAIPEITVEHVDPSPIPGLFEVTSGPAVFYVTADAHYVLYGELLALEKDEIRNLTEETRGRFVKESLAKLNPNTFIVFPATTSAVKSTITIGTDVDCVYCKRLHDEVPKLNAAGITVRYIAFPRTPPGTPSYKKSEMIWCAKDPKKTIDEAFAGKKVAPQENADCKPPIAEHLAFIQQIGAAATPIIILEDGLVLPGYIPADELIEIVEMQK